jgi:hypothetical protein
MNNMRKTFALVVLCSVSGDVWGHGTPLDLFVENNRLIAHHPLDQTFAPPIFGQPDEFDDFSDVDSFPPTGNVILWDIPGLDIHDMNGTASLSIEVLARPVIGSPTGEHRVLWYWNPDDETVEQSPAEFHLFGTGARVLTLQPGAEQSPGPFLLASQLEGQVGYHNHSLMFYGLDDDATAPAGVYGFYARFTSNQYAASDPCLVLFNYFTENEQLADVGLAIHAAATLPGDFDLDDDVDGRDFLLWQRLCGSATRTVADASLNGVVDAADLAIWRQNYGTVFGGETMTTAIVVPEPPSLLAAIACLGLFTYRRT